VQCGDVWLNNYFGAIEHVIMEPIQAVIVAEGFSQDSAEGKLTAFFTKHSPEKIKEVRVMSEHLASKETEEEREQFLQQLNEALMEKFGEDLNSIGEEEAALHEWTETVDPASGSKYWFKADGTSTWDDPHASTTEAPATEAQTPTEQVTIEEGEAIPQSPDITSPSQLPQVEFLGNDGTADPLVLRLEKAIMAESAAAADPPSEGAKQTHLKTEARLRRWHQTITDVAKNESEKTLARNLAEAYLARAQGNTGFGNSS
jgi:hypothetical protein